MCRESGKHGSEGDSGKSASGNSPTIYPTPVTGCTRVSPGCDHCYMYALYPRLKAMSARGYESGPDDVQLLPERLQAPLSWRKPRRVFVNSMSDVFHPRVPFDFVLEMFLVMQEAAARRGHIFQVLTKRPGRAVAWWQQHEEHFPDGWPARIWMGTSVESQKYAARLTVLSRLPAPIRFVSAEPLLESLDLSQWLEEGLLSDIARIWYRYFAVSGFASALIA